MENSEYIKNIIDEFLYEKIDSLQSFLKKIYQFIQIIFLIIYQYFSIRIFLKYTKKKDSQSQLKQELLQSIMNHNLYCVPFLENDIQELDIKKLSIKDY